MMHQPKLHPAPVKKHLVLKGLGASAGEHTGRIKIILSTEDSDTIQPNDIVVTSHGGPWIVHLLPRAGAIVTDEGGITSQMAILARELKKPCIVALRGALHYLHDGDTVHINGASGIIHVLERTL